MIPLSARQEITPVQASRLFVVMATVFAVVNVFDSLNDAVLPVEVGIDLLVGLGVPALLVVVAYRLVSTQTTEATTRLIGWWAVGTVAFFGPSSWLVFNEIIDGTPLADPLLIISTATALGGIVGLVAGQHHLSRSPQPTTETRANSAEAADKPDRETPETETAAEHRFRTYTEIHEQSQARQERIVDVLFETDRHMLSVGQLADRLTSRAGREHSRRTTLIQLHHHDLPALSETELCSYDPATRQITNHTSHSNHE